jgi:hypothetical protein
LNDTQSMAARNLKLKESKLVEFRETINGMDVALDNKKIELEKAERARQGLHQGCDEMNDRQRMVIQDFKLKEDELIKCRETSKLNPPRQSES